METTSLDPQAARVAIVLRQRLGRNARSPRLTADDAYKIMQNGMPTDMATIKLALQYNKRGGPTMSALGAAWDNAR